MKIRKVNQIKKLSENIVLTKNRKCFPNLLSNDEQLFYNFIK